MPRFLTQSQSGKCHARVLQGLSLTKPALEAKFNAINREEKRNLREASQDPSSGYSTMTGSLRSVRNCNRYSDVLPFDKNRVRIDKYGSDYINASHVNVELGDLRKRYIATQGPTEASCGDFWQMCVQQTKSDTIVVVMLTPLTENGVSKCDKYWPEVGTFYEYPAGETNKYSLEVRHVSTKDVEGHFQLNEFDVICKPGNREPDLPLPPPKKCFHLYFYDWLDFKAPASFEVIKLLSDTANLLNVGNDPLIVHCSAGVGRTGTFIALDFMLTRGSVLLKANERESGECEVSTPVQDLEDPVYAIVRQLRSQRVMMVQRFEQYAFIYNSLLAFSLKELK